MIPFYVSWSTYIVNLCSAGTEGTDSELKIDTSWRCLSSFFLRKHPTTCCSLSNFNHSFILQESLNLSPNTGLFPLPRGFRYWDNCGAHGSEVNPPDCIVSVLHLKKAVEASSSCSKKVLLSPGFGCMDFLGKGKHLRVSGEHHLNPSTKNKQSLQARVNITDSGDGSHCTEAFIDPL